MAVKTYGKLYFDVNSDTWVMHDVAPHVRIKLKRVFNKIPKSETTFKLGKSPEDCRDIEWFISRYPMEISDDDMALLNRNKDFYLENLHRTEQIFLPDYKPSDFDLKIPLRPYQAKAVDMLMRCKRLLLGDDLGLGKTSIGIAAATRKECLPAIVVVQTHLPRQWVAQIEKFSSLSTYIINGTKPYLLPKADVYIISYSKLSGWHDVITNGDFKFAVFDECQELRRADSNKYQSAMALSKSVEYCVGLSATPIYNFGDEIYSILNLIKEGCLGFYSDFLREWCGYSNRVKDPKALGSYLRDAHLFLRRTKVDVGMEMPALNKIVHEIEYDKAEMKKSQDICRELAIATMTGSFVERGRAARDLDIRMRQSTGIAKARYAAKFVKFLVESGTPVLMAAWHRECYDIYLDVLKDYNPVLYTGSESPTEKDKSREKFMSGESKVMIISLRSGIGLDGLQNCCSTVVFAELDWSGQVHEQVIGRLNRYGQKEPVTAIYLVTNEGSDPPMISLLGIKADQADGILDPFGSTQQTVSDDSRIKLLAKSVLEPKLS